MEAHARQGPFAADERFHRFGEPVDPAASERVRRALRILTPADRTILRLAYREGVPPREIAQRLGEPVESIRERKSRAVARLRRAFRVS